MARLNVKSHYRNGKYIQSYQRSHTPRVNTKMASAKVGLAPLASISSDGTSRQTLVDRNGKIFTLSDMKALLIEDADFSGYSFDGINVSHVRFKNCNMSNTKFSACKLKGMDVSRSDFSGAQFLDSEIWLSQIKDRKSVV